MAKIGIDDIREQRIKISEKIGNTGASGGVSVNRKGAIGVGIDVGIASVGVTTDYGGGISVGIAGQSVTLGTEGGNIKLGIGGFDVRVEARDCVVVETKYIFGQIVAQRSYPDPGCKPEKPTPTPTPTPTPAPEDDGTSQLQGDGYAWVVINEIAGSSGFTKRPESRIDYSYEEKTIQTITINGNTPVKNGQLDLNLFSAIKTYTRSSKSNNESTYPTGSLTTKTTHNKFSHTGGAGGITAWTFYNYDSLEKQSNPADYEQRSSIQSSTGTCAIFYGKQSAIKTNILQYNSDPSYNRTNTTSNQWETSSKISYRRRIVGGVFTAEATPPAPFLPTGNKPPMKEDCCEEILDDLEDIKEAFAVDRILKDKFPISNSFMAPGVDPNSQTEAKNYYEIAQCIIRMMAHGMIFEPEAVMKDSDSAKVGDQPLKVKYLNATGWAKAVSEMLFEVRDDGNVSTNMDLRNGFTVSQLLVAVADIVQKTDTVLDCLGVPTKHKIEVVTTAFNCMVQVGKGFGDKNQQQIDLNADEATESLLPEFLKTRENKLKTVEIHPRSESLFDILRQIQQNIPAK